MKCRRINPENGMIVWFGVKDIEKKDALLVSENTIAGENTIISDGISIKSIFQNENDKHDNYATESEGVVNSLRERLSVLKNELWYDYENGMPLIDKIRSKAVIDAYIIQKILEHPDVINIDGFESEQIKHEYSCYMIINTIYGQVELGI